jgi:hypothetical protein
MSGMSTRDAACSCGQLRVTVEGDPFEVTMCHCRACQQRTGSAFGLQAGYGADQARIEGRSREYARTSTEPDRRVHMFHFCPHCGSTVYCTEPDAPEFVAVMAGAFADRDFPAPSASVYGTRRHRWVTLPEGIENDEVWDELRPLYGAGEYAAVADRGGELIAAHHTNAQLIYNVACCESMAGRTADALAHLRQAIAIAPDRLRRMAADDSDLDAIRGEPGFAELLGEITPPRVG